MEMIDIKAKIDPHKSQWERLYKKNMDLSKNKDDFYHYRASSCKSLLEQFC